MSIQLESSWKAVLEPEFNKPYMHELKKFLQIEKKQHTVFPPGHLIFNAFNHTPFDQVKVVILGQDPYHNVGQAHGLSFSVPRGVGIPPSLRNMYQELSTDIPGFQIPAHGDLTAWANRGVLLLNATLTVRAHTAGSHQGKGWEAFTDKAIAELSARRSGIVFLLWGRYAKDKAALIDYRKHHILTAAHPSPFSAHNGFFGCKHFSKANAFLVEQGLEPIDWQV
ncbi:uracil-DNA glycosylase 2 [Parapedobacter defluvii]|uniref:Uracil-DNA glycosylase n=1 Tax=Parapedobacter defluvii TaxID=2045106 RepID=A0ABQ1LZT1_9SPHI|nr:uracil-DNA glycosylase [Parapedobacter defluvii]RQP17640.1 MAG: uracil-DNA glycosylase [Parapedobacter sp.]GGC31032.1 uracil-DNA glycosylase 2 [Parapedobacter defluvii]